ncbi:MAG: hypothetical protein ACKVON_07875 [Beijerinckiaceae bacterium]
MRVQFSRESPARALALARVKRSAEPRPATGILEGALVPGREEWPRLRPGENYRRQWPPAGRPDARQRIPSEREFCRLIQKTFAIGVLKFWMLVHRPMPQY